MVPAPFIVVVDANVLFPLTLRDTILRAAACGFYQLRWSREILDEMEHSLVATGTITAAKAARLRKTMETFFPEALVIGYEPLVAAMQNDVKDRHVVAAAVKACASCRDLQHQRLHPTSGRDRSPAARRVPVQPVRPGSRNLRRHAARSSGRSSEPACHVQRTAG